MDMQTIKDDITNLKTEVSTNSDLLAKILVTLGSIECRLNVLEQYITSNSIASKRAIKVDPSLITVDKEKEKHTPLPDCTSSSTKDVKKITNALTFFKKKIIYENYNNLRDKYYDDSYKPAKTTGKKVEGSEAYWVSIGGAIWKKLSNTDKATIKTEFVSWNDIHQNLNIAQLNEDISNNNVDD